MEVIVGIQDVDDGHLLSMVAASPEGRGMFTQSLHTTKTDAQTAIATQCNLLRIIGLDIEVVQVNIPNLNESPERWLVDYDPEEYNAHVVHVD
jgi:hypothetical protein